MGELIFSGSADGTVRMWDLGSNREMDRKIHAYNTETTDLKTRRVNCVHAHGRYLATAGDDCQINLYKIPYEDRHY